MHTTKTFINEIVQTKKCAQCKKWIVHLWICAKCKSCISKIICAADLRILCTTVFRTFADLRICVLCMCRSLRTCFAFVQKVSNMWKCFRECARVCEFMFFTFFTEFANLSVFCQNVEKVEISENVPKMSEKSSRVPEWYTSGSWPNAFDNTGWQKSPEYALIRIAAGAPDLAKSGQIRPRTAPDGKSSRIWRRFRFCSTGWNPVRSCFFLTRAQISDPSTCSRGASSSATESDTFCKCAHTSQNTRWNRRQGSGHSAHCAHRAHRNRHTCTNCAHRNTDVHTCAQPRHSSRHKWQRTHRPCVALVGKVGGAERPRAIDSSYKFVLFNIFYSFVFYFLLIFTSYSRYAKR